MRRVRSDGFLVLLLGLALAALGSRSATALTIEVALPGLVGAYEQVGDTRGDSFDFGVRFSEIESITLRFEVGDADQGGMCTLSIPGYCTTGSVLEATLSGDGEQVLGGIWGMQHNGPNWMGIPRPGGWSLTPSGYDLGPIGSDPIVPPPIAAWPEFLLRGWGDISLRLGGLDQPYGFHRAEILQATVIVTGTPIPAPSTAASVLLGLLMLQARSKRLPRQRD